MPPNARYAHFADAEVEGLDPELVTKLDAATARTEEITFEKRRIPFIITSGFRPPEKNQSVIGAVADSSHLTGKGADLKVETSHDVFVMVAALIWAGINRIGVYVNKDWQPIHIHCDIDLDKVPQVLFIRQEQN